MADKDLKSITFSDLPDRYVIPKEVFWATYGATTYDEIGAALTAGKLVVCEYSGVYYIYEMRVVDTRYFRNGGGYWLTVTSGNVWSQGQSLPPSAATATPANLGTAAVGSSSKYAKEDHVHAMPTAANVGAIAAPVSASNGQFLMYNGSAWVASSLPTYNGGVS